MSPAQITRDMDVKRFYNSSQLSDVRIKFDSRFILAHKIVLCGQSSWFRKALEGPFKEASTPVIELHDDDPDAIESLLKHLYGLDSFGDEVNGKEEIIKVVMVYKVADKYDVPDLRTKMVEKFKGVGQNGWRKLWVDDAVQEIMECVYDSTVASNDPLREEAVDVFMLCREGMKQSEDKLVSILEALPELSARLSYRLMKQEDKFKETLRTSILPMICQDSLPHTLAKDGNLDGWIHLITLGYDVNIQDGNGETPLHWAAWAGRLDVTRLLLDFEADVRATSHVYGSTALEWARERMEVEHAIEANAALRNTEYERVIELLEQAEANAPVQASTVP